MYINLIQMAYESNFRANLIKTVYEKAVDSDRDLHEAGRPLYFALGGSVLPDFKLSPLQHKQELVKLAEENEYFYECSPRACPNLDELDAILETGILLLKA